MKLNKKSERNFRALLPWLQVDIGAYKAGVQPNRKKSQGLS